MKNKKGKISLFSILLILSIIVSSFVVQANSIDVVSGNIYYAKLEGIMNTVRWGGLLINQNNVDLPYLTTPFSSYNINTPAIMSLLFAGQNLEKGSNYYAATFANNFDLNNLESITYSDVVQGGIFDSTSFPIFYPDYSDYNDNPEITFCCTEETIKIGGENFTAYRTDLEQNSPYYLLKYNNGGVYEPFFISEINHYSCYNSLYCVSQFILPISPRTYNFYALSEMPPVDFTVWIDGVQTNTFSQTAKPYELEVEAKYLYTGNYIENMNILVGENNGQNIFIPYRLSGYVTSNYAIGETNTLGRETFIVAPTIYPSTVENYSIYLNVLYPGDILSNKEKLFVTNKDQIILNSKTISPAPLFDNAKASVNAMNQITNFLFRWSSQLLQAKKFTIIYDRGTNSFIEQDLQGGSVITLKTGAPNVITAFLNNNGFPEAGYIEIQETDGYLIMNPVTQNTIFTDKERRHFQRISTNQEFIITPTSYGSVTSTITIKFYDANGLYLNSKNINIDDSLNIGTGGLFYNNDLLKTIVNAMNQVINSLYYSLNN